MQGADIYTVLKGKGIYRLYHANTVTTSCTFLKVGGLASRGYIEDRKLPQTSQYTDSLDKKFGVWYDVFADTVDIHERAGRIKVNQYGPVLFIFDLEILKTLPTKSDVFITKKNPTKWTTREPDDKRFFLTQKELESSLIYGEFDQMIVIKTPDGILPFSNGTVKIVLDDPQRALSNGIPAYKHAIDRLEAAAHHKVSIQVTKRVCRYGCRCIEFYKAFGDFDKFFE